jgi:hypothetical protein
MISGCPVSEATAHETVSYSHQYEDREYEVEKIASYDDVETVKTWQRRMIHLQPIIGMISMISYLIYFIYRLLVTCRYMSMNKRFSASLLFIVTEATCLGNVITSGLSLMA